MFWPAWIASGVTVCIRSKVQSGCSNILWILLFSVFLVSQLCTGHICPFLHLCKNGLSVELTRTVCSLCQSISAPRSFGTLQSMFCTSHVWMGSYYSLDAQGSHISHYLKILVGLTSTIGSENCPGRPGFNDSRVNEDLWVEYLDLNVSPVRPT